MRRPVPAPRATPPVREPAEQGWFPSSWAPYGIDWSGATIVRAGENLQAALNNARAGDIVMLEAGASWRGNFTLPPTNSGTTATARTSMHWGVTMQWWLPLPEE